MIDFEAAKEFALNKLNKELKPELCYHCYSHTIDVYESAIQAPAMENVNGNDLVLIKTAALFHDIGFLVTYYEHEEQSANETRKYLPQFGFTAKDIEIIAAMILSTKLPQNPKTHLEKILCDADLTISGRDDFFSDRHKTFMRME